MRDTSELVKLVTLWNITKCNILMVGCGPLHLAFSGDVAYAYTNIQQVAEEEEEEEEEDPPLIDTWRNARVWVDFFGGLR
jgi:hypothetical protein